MKTKKQLNLYSFYDLEGMAAHLEDMARQGWFLKKAGVLLWQYEQGEPKNLHYTVCCTGETSSFDATKEEPSFRIHAQKAGWKVEVKNDRLMIFSTEQSDPAPLVASPYDRIEGVRQASRPSLFLNYTMMGLGVLSVLLLLFRMNTTPVAALAGSVGLVSPAVMVLLGLFFLADTILYYRWRSAALIGATEHKYVPVTSHMNRVLIGVLLVCGGLLILAAAASGGSPMVRTFFVYLAAILALLILIGSVRSGLRASRNKGLLIGTNVILAVVLVVGLTAGVGKLNALDQGLGGTLPLKAQDLGLAAQTDQLSDYVRTKSSFLLSHSEASQVRVLEDGSYESLISYEMVEGRAAPVDGKVLTYYLNRMASAVAVSEEGNRVPGYVYEPVDENLFGAKKAWQLRDSEQQFNVYLLLFENRLVELGCAVPLTEEQMAVCGEKLS